MEYSLDGSSEESDDESIWSLDSDEAYEADNIYYDEQENYLTEVRTSTVNPNDLNIAI